MSITVDEMNELAKSIREQEEKYEAAKKEATAQFNALEKLENLMGKALLDLGQDKFQTPYGTMVLTKRTSFKVPKLEEDRAIFFEKLKEMGVYEDMITVNSATMNGFLKDEYKAAEARGEDMVVYRFPGVEPPTVSVTASLRKAK